MDIRSLQRHIWELYGHHDKRRGVWKTYLWLFEEVRELGEAIKREDLSNAEEEIADVLAWLLSVANLLRIDVNDVVMKRYGSVCPKCKNIPCRCKYRDKPT